jgi:hypothetical protein
MVRQRDLDESSQGSTASSHSVSSHASNRGAEHFHIGSRPGSQAGDAIREEAQQPAQANDLTQALMIQMQELQARQQAQNEEFTGRVTELAGRVDLVETENGGLRATNEELAGRVDVLSAVQTQTQERERRSLREVEAQNELDSDVADFQKAILEQQVLEGAEENQTLRGQLTASKAEARTAKAESRTANERADRAEARNVRAEARNVRAEARNVRAEARNVRAEARLDEPKSDLENIAGAVNFLTNPLRSGGNPALGAGKTVGFFAASAAASTAFPPALFVTLPLYFAHGMGTVGGICAKLRGTEEPPIESCDIFKN